MDEETVIIILLYAIFIGSVILYHRSIKKSFERKKRKRKIEEKRNKLKNKRLLEETFSGLLEAIFGGKTQKKNKVV